VYEPPRVNRLECREHRERHVDAVAKRNRPAREPRRKRLTIEQLHGDEELPVRLAHLVQLAHVRMRDAGGGPSLAPEALARLRIAARFAHHLESDLAMETLVCGGVDDPHSSFAELRHHSVMGNRVGHLTSDFTRPRKAPCRQELPFSAVLTHPASSRQREELASS
jgi:hypothetical protein